MKNILSPFLFVTATIVGFIAICKIVNTLAEQKGNDIVAKIVTPIKEPKTEYHIRVIPYSTGKYCWSLIEFTNDNWKSYTTLKEFLPDFEVVQDLTHTQGEMIDVAEHLRTFAKAKTWNDSVYYLYNHRKIHSPICADTLKIL